MDKIWLKSYPKGVPELVDVKHYSSIAHIYYESIQKYPDKIAFRHYDNTFTFKEIDIKVGQFAAFLQSNLSLKKGDRIALMMPNMMHYPIALFAALCAGLVVVNVNPLYTQRELESQLKDAKVSAIVCVDFFAATLSAVLPALNNPKVIIASFPDFWGGLRSLAVQFFLKYIKKKIPTYSIENAITFKKALELGKAHKFSPADITLKDKAFLQYTGGTTGVAKGAVLTHGNMVANVLQACAWLASSIKAGEEIIVTALPLYHIFSLMANCILFFKYGAENILITNPKDINEFVEHISKRPFTALTGVNTLFNALLYSKKFRELDFSSLKLALGGGMAVQKVVAEKFKKLTGVPLLEAYGLTETSPGVAINPLTLKSYRGSVGLPLPSTDVSIRDDQGNELGLNEIGELYVKGPQVMQGYWRKPEETKNVFDNGWLKTGDIAKIDEKGYLYIVDRKKDMILVSGFNVYPNEIEDVVMQCKGVKEVAAVGKKHRIAGEVVKLFVVRKDDTLTKEAILAHCRQYLTSYKIPKKIEFKDSLPKSNVGKILRRELQDK